MREPALSGSEGWNPVSDCLACLCVPGILLLWELPLNVIPKLNSPQKKCCPSQRMLMYGPPQI